MEKHLISVIVPAYNIAQYLPRCLDSLLAQTHRDLEILVVNDGSTDETGRILDHYAAGHSRIRAIHKENGGVSSARLAGIAAATGSWIGFVDGDDYAEPGMFAHLLANGLAHNADISHCGYRMVFPDGHVDMYHNTGVKLVQDRAQGLKDLILGSRVEPGLWNKLFRRELLEGFDAHPVWDSSIRINEDLLMNYILFGRARCSVFEDIPYYHYILRKGSAATSHASRQKTTDPLRVMGRILEDTAADPTLHPAAAERYLRVLMSVAQQSYWPEDAASARQELKKRLPGFAAMADISKKVVLMAIGVAWLGPVYRLVRKVYNLRTGVDKKYDLE